MNDLDALQLRHAKIQARRYLKFAQSASGPSARYTMEEYLRLQGVAERFIPQVVSSLWNKLGMEEYATD